MNNTQAVLIKSLSDEIFHLKNNLKQSDQTIDSLNEQLNWLKRQIFGKRSEKIISNVNCQQLEFEGFSKFFEKDKEETKKISAYQRRTSIKGKDKIILPPDLPVKTIIIDIPEKEKICKKTGQPLVKIGKEVSLKLAHKPGSYYIKEIIRPKYAHPQKEEAGIFIAALPDSIIPKCRADESFLSDVLVKKFADHQPLYRIAEILSREGIRISRKLISSWVVRIGTELRPLYNEMIKQILSGGNIFIDETPIKMQDKAKCKQTYMWVIVGGKGSDPPYRIYDFRETRSHCHVKDMLSGYRQVLHSDKYGGYEQLAQSKQFIWCPYWSHVRRKFFEAEFGDMSFRKWVLRKIRYLFMLEKVAWPRDEKERFCIRKEKEVPIIGELIEKIKIKIQDHKILPKSKFKQALWYFCGLIPYLKNYTNYPFARLDNNVAERAIRPIAIGRKNWLFIGSPDGGRAAAVLLSLIQTCRNLKINPQIYLEDMMRRFMSHSANKLYELLPDQWAKKYQK